jgi:cystathionine beta-lyase/cystathionine gamma-synthase
MKGDRDEDDAMAQDTSEIDTRLQHPRVGGAVGGEPVAPPIYQSSTYVLPSPELGAEIAASWHPQRFYTRYGSPNVALVESIVADLEGAESAVAVGSGMAAISAAILSHVSAGDHVVAQTAHYTAALSLMTKWLPRQGVAVTQVDQTDIEAFRNAIGPRTRLVYVETPTNPTMALTDLEAVSALAHRQGAIAVADNTFASSFNQRPLALGVDLVVQSATKYLNGHSDVTAGLVMGSRKLVEPVWEYARVHGPVLHPMEAWLLARGLKTYALRIRQHNQSAALVAKALSETSGVARVHYPGLASHPQHGLARRQMPGGYGGMLSFEVAGATGEERFARAQAVLRKVRLCVSAASLGGTETLITHPASMIFSHQSPDQLAAAGVETGLLRLSVGLEHPQDIVDDLVHALSNARG